MIQIISDIIIGLGILFMVLGLIGITRHKKFYVRILIASKVDTVGFITIVIGMIIRHGVSFFSAKLLLIVILTIVLAPLVAHIVSRSAYQDSMPANKDDIKKDIKEV